jgi:hypothetical protein
MPYSGADDNSLPKNVKKLPKKMRSQWVNVFESALGAGDDEGTAMTKANGVVKKKKGLVESWDLEVRQFSRTQSGYMPMGMTPDKGCANCHWFASPDSCVLVYGDVSPTGNCNLWQDTPDYGEDITGMATDSDDSFFSNIVRRVKDALRIGPVQSDAEEPIDPIIFYKDGDSGRYRFFTIYTNCFKDAHKEIITDAAHREYVDWATRTGLYPELHLWHAGNKSKWGQVDWLEYNSGFVCASGLVDEDKEYIAEALKGQDISVSQGFVGIWTKGDIISLYRTFEISPLPLGHAANNYVDFNIREEKEMPFSTTKKEWLKSVAKLDDATINDWEKSVDRLSLNVKALGIEYKEEGETDIVLQFKSLTDVVNSVVESMTALKTQIDANTTAVAELATKQTSINDELDKRVADVFVAEVSKLPVGFVATSEKGNVVNVKDTRADVTWFGEVLKDAVKGAQ